MHMSREEWFRSPLHVRGCPTLKSTSALGSPSCLKKRVKFTCPSVASTIDGWDGENHVQSNCDTYKQSSACVRRSYLHRLSRTNTCSTLRKWACESQSGVRMKRVYCPDCKTRMIVGLRGLAMCENCKMFIDLNKQKKGTWHPLVALVVLLAVFSLITLVVSWDKKTPRYLGSPFFTLLVRLMWPQSPLRRLVPRPPLLMGQSYISINSYFRSSTLQ